MALSLKELVIVLVIASLVFAFLKPIALNFTTPEDFARRRNVWIALTVTAFASPSFWLYLLVAAIVLLISGRKDSNPGALFLLLMHVIPPFEVTIPMIGINSLMDIDNYFIMSFFVMAPAALRMRGPKAGVRPYPLESMDVLLLAYVGLLSFLYVHAETSIGVIAPFTFTSALRRMVELYFLSYVPFYVISRSASERRAMRELMMWFIIACALMAAIAIFESLRHWLMFGEMSTRWGYGSRITNYVGRGDSLRGSASSGHPLSLGIMLAIAFGFWLYLQAGIASMARRLAMAALLLAGLIVTYARGPWLGAILIYFGYFALSGRMFTRILKATVLAAIVAVIIGYSPLGEKLWSLLPFVGGSKANESLLYRERLFERAWQIIMQNPLLGDQEALLKMSDLRQGEQIIDLVNTYVSVLLDNGFLGLTLFLAFILIAMLRVMSFRRQLMPVDRDGGLLGSCILACILAMLPMLWNSSFIWGYERVFYLLAGLAAGYAHLGRAALRDPHGNVPPAVGPVAAARR